ncbi:MAG: protease inhibitor I42 family protein [Desulfarculaceae bacterium]|nr:protease inhibitor I42 family protein [Desulfarculaceae bacterium]MCF8072183.1 protease inhibitor I42 family protein [Desulfarculaceae bacterium]MCF8100104.1 protease inhibitor I42 family protein [Desulfarculaceae bacterium]MCF8117247.1 protease inhibitor I42 family protein [Desulfarculaceae bacterium]
MKPWMILLLAAALALGLTGPAGAKAPAQVLVLEPGQVFKITLAANHTTGYQWVLAALPPAKVVKLVSKNYAADKPKDQEGKPLAGAGGYEVWIFQAVGPGTAFISLHYLRPWEKNKPPAKSRSLEVQVR